ncbi:MAG TPA: ATP-binding protein [Candidatus Xenobia bacterium]|jgi:hypothetical protein
MDTPHIKPRERDALIQSLRAGVVPRVGHRLIQVGRARELEALLGDLDRVAQGSAAIRFVIGDYGSGKSFFLSLVRTIALEKRLVTVHADLGPDRRLHASGGQARSLYAELMRNLATRAKPEGGALPSLVERFVTTATTEAQTNGVSPVEVIRKRLESLSEGVGGYDFAQVVEGWWRGWQEGKTELQADAIRWLRGEFTTKTQARQALGVRTVVDDASVYDHLKLVGALARLAGYDGMLVLLDEMVNLYKLQQTQARNANYEQILRILNDSLQGNVSGLGFLLAGTPEFLLDTRRGLYSYAALQTRLAENTFARDGLTDTSGPVLRLASLTPEDLYVLLSKLRSVYAGGDESRMLVPDQALSAFLAHSQQRVGDAAFRTPRMTVKAFLDLLAILEQNPGARWQNLLPTVDIAQDAPQPDTDDDLASFTL